MKYKLTKILCLAVSILLANTSLSQEDTTKPARQYKNVLRYNLSGALVFGIDKYIIFGYERIVQPNQSFSVNIGSVSLPKLGTIVTDSFTLSKDLKSSGFNFSVDYRFYLQKENKYAGPHGFYIGPYYSFNHFTRDSQWDLVNPGTSKFVNTNSDFDIHTIGFEMGYQVILWKRWALDLLMVGPGLGIYKYTAKFDENIDPANKKQLQEGLKQLLTQKFPGMNYVFSESQFDANGSLSTTTLGYRYLISIGYTF